MANTYTQLYIQFVFTVKGRANLISETFREELEKVICGIVNHQNCKPIAIYCMPDHTHLLIGMNPVMSPSKLMEVVKSGSSNWLNEKKYITGPFSWQKGYGAFTYSRGQLSKVINYISNQPEHHKKNSFRDEYLSLLQEFGIDYDEKYLFEFLN